MHRITAIFSLVMMLGFGSVALGAQQTSVDTTGLSADQVKALSAAVAELRKQPANTIANLSLATTTPDKWKEWAEAGSAAGQAVGNFTKELGIAADQFLQTGVGKVSLYALIWKFGGDQVAAHG